MFERLLSSRRLSADRPISLTAEGSGRDETLTGGSDADTLSGRGGDDQLIGLGGDDLLMGGAGDDWIDGGTGLNTLVGGYGADTISGSGFQYGGDGADHHTAYNSDTTVNGGPGDDFYEIGEGVTVEESADGGVDLLFWQGGTCWLPKNVENGGVLITPSDLHGNRLDNNLNTFAGAGFSSGDVFGEGGSDTISGTLCVLNGGAGDDRLYSYEGGSLLGGSGDDTLSAADGSGRWLGGKGADVFLAAENGLHWGLIEDFKPQQGDVIDLSLIDADSSAPGDQAFVFVDTFTAVAGQARLAYSRNLGRTELQLDIDGDGQPDMTAWIDDRAHTGEGWVL